MWRERSRSLRINTRVKAKRDSAGSREKLNRVVSTPPARRTSRRLRAKKGTTTRSPYAREGSTPTREVSQRQSISRVTFGRGRATVDETVGVTNAVDSAWASLFGEDEEEVKSKGPEEEQTDSDSDEFPEMRKCSEINTAEEMLDIVRSKAYCPVGLENTGNVCYFLSIFQNLMQCDLLCQILLAEEAKCAKDPFLRAMRGTLRKYFSYVESEQVLNLKPLLEEFRSKNVAFDNSYEHDAAEALGALLHDLGSSESQIDALFRVQLHVERKVKLNWRNQPIQEKKDHCFVLRVLCQNRVGNLFTSVDECLRHEFKWREMDDKLKWEDGKRYEFEQRTLVDHKSLPAYLFIQLARFTVRRRNTAKLSHDIQIPASLDLGPFTTNTQRDAIYKLQGFVSHVGPSASSGHYTASIITHRKEYYRCNDESVSRKRHFETSGAYLLLYKKDVFE